MLKGASIEQCLRDYPEHAAALRPLLEVSAAAKKAAAIEPSAAFRHRARQQLYAAFERKESRRARAFMWRPVWVTFSAVLLTLVVAGGGTVAAATVSMPDEPLYPVKLATEQVHLKLTFSPIKKAALHARLAKIRIAEIVTMAAENKPAQVEKVAQELNINLDRVAALTAPQAKESADMMISGSSGLTAPRATAMPPAATNTPGSVPAPTMAPTQPATTAPTTEPNVTSSNETETLSPAPEPATKWSVNEGYAEDTRLSSTALDARAALKAVILRDAIKNPAKLRALLKTVPESARPALLRAIIISEVGYEKALEALAK